MALGILGRKLVGRILLTNRKDGPLSCWRLIQPRSVLGLQMSSAAPVESDVSKRRETGAWREGASLIITAKTKVEQGMPDGTEFDYKFLVLKKKHDKRGMFEFPGGAVTHADFAIQWAELFRKATKLDFGDIVQDFHMKNGNQPPILQKNENGIPAGLGTRIAAIRETFEATGILIVKGLLTPRLLMQQVRSYYLMFESTCALVSLLT